MRGERKRQREGRRESGILKKKKEEESGTDMEEAPSRYLNQMSSMEAHLRAEVRSGLKLLKVGFGHFYTHHVTSVYVQECETQWQV